jgi:hypothetical protein
MSCICDESKSVCYSPHCLSFYKAPRIGCCKNKHLIASCFQCCSAHHEEWLRTISNRHPVLKDVRDIYSSPGLDGESRWNITKAFYVLAEILEQRHEPKNADGDRFNSLDI